MTMTSAKLRKACDKVGGVYAMVIEAECGGGAADAVLLRQLDSQVPQRLGNTSAPLLPLPPGSKPGSGLGQILR
jgi:hypothetical protein